MTRSPTTSTSSAHTETPPPSLPNPWLDNPAPTAPWLETHTYTPKRFKDSYQRCHNHQPFPYRQDSHNERFIYFYELRGYGRPSTDVGYPGDVYLDLTPNPYLIYVRYKKEWKLWNWSDVNPQQRSFTLAIHPILQDRLLWGGPKGLTWYTASGLGRTKLFNGWSATEYYNPQDMVAEMILHDPFHPSEEQRGLMEVEQKRRQERCRLNTTQAESLNEAPLVQDRHHATNGLNHADDIDRDSMVQHSAASSPSNLNVTELDPHNTDMEESLYAREIKTIHKSLKRMLEQDEKDGNASADIEKRRRISAEEELNRVKISLEAQVEKLQTELKLQIRQRALEKDKYLLGSQIANEMVKMYELDLKMAQKERERVEQRLKVVEGTIRNLLKAD